MGWGLDQPSKSRNHKLQVPGKQLQGCGKLSASSAARGVAGIPFPERVRTGQGQTLSTWAVRGLRALAQTASGSVPGSVPSSSLKGTHFNKSGLWDSCL